jgi:hypothetical protein
MGDHEAEKRPTGPRSGVGKASRKRARPLKIPAKGRLLEVQQFAEIVKEFATDVQTFYERRVEDRLVTENLQTRFKNGLARMREECLVALRVFRGLTKAAKERPGKDAQDVVADKMIGALRRGGCEDMLESIQKQLTTVINRLDKPLSPTEARNILDDVRQLWADTRSLGNFANAIQRNIRHALMRARSGGAPEIPADIQKRLEAVEDATRRFIEMVGKQPRTPGLHGKAITEWLHALQGERETLVGAKKALANALQAFVNRSIAALTGNPAMSAIVVDIKDALQESRSRVAVSSSILETYIRSIAAGVDSDEAAHTAARLMYLLTKVLADQADIDLRVGKMARKAKAAVTDAAIDPATLPAWSALSEDEQLLLLVLVAHHDEEGNDSTVTKKKIEEALQQIQPRATLKSWKSWVNRRLKELHGKGAVVRETSPIKRISDEFRMSSAALAKYRGAAAPV